MVGGRGDEGHARGGVPGLGNVALYLVAGQLATLSCRHGLITFKVWYVWCDCFCMLKRSSLTGRRSIFDIKQGASKPKTAAVCDQEHAVPNE
eukprot:1137810-Pelagomonas_calceolata.AAC.3